MKKYKKQLSSNGFSLVELLVTIVVIGILVAIVAVSYVGIRQKAIDASLQSDLNNAYQKLILDKAVNFAYPNTLAEANDGKGITASSGTTFSYSANNTTSSKTFCLDATNSGKSYKVTNSSSEPVAGNCLDYGLVGYWALDNTTGMTDLSPSGNNGTANGGIAIGTATNHLGVANKATTFDGTDDYVNVGSGASLQLTSTGTVSLWFKPTIAFSGNTGVQQHFACGAREFYFSGSSSLLYYFLADDTTSSNSNSSSWGAIWYHVVATSDGTIVKMYINSVVQTGTGNATGKNFFYNTTPVTISRSSAGFKGSISDVRIYNHALSQTEITSLYNSN